MVGKAPSFQGVKWLKKEKKRRFLPFFYVLVAGRGFASLEPPAKQSTGLFFCLRQTRKLSFAGSQFKSPLLLITKNGTKSAAF